MGMFYPLIKSLLFSLPPEKAHDLTLKVASLSPTLGKLTGIHAEEQYSVEVGKCRWSFPLGLAAGLDKNAEALPFFEAQGFGAIECGTVTLRPQLGNDKPRIFRYPEELSLRNSMGFPNQGLASILPRVQSFKAISPLGINIGKNKESNPEESIEELSILFDSLKHSADYFVINVSSPNTPGLRAFQEPGYLKELFSELNLIKGSSGPDLYLKIAPDLTSDQIRALTQISSESKLTGLIATNTTIVPSMGGGGVSGIILREKARKVRKEILNLNSSLELIGVGGVSRFEDLLDFWNEGGKVMQIYTSYIYGGPAVLKQTKNELAKFIQFQGMNLQNFLNLNLSEKRERIKNFRNS